MVLFGTNAVVGLAIARELGPAGRGEVTYAFLLMSIGSTVASVGLDHAATRVLAPQQAPSRADLRRILLLALLSGTLVAGVVTAGAMLLREPLNPAAVLVGVLAYTISQVGAPAALACRLVHRVATVRVIAGVGYLAASLVALYAHAWPGWLVWAWTGAGVLLGAAFFGVAWQRTSVPSSPPAPYSRLLTIGRTGWQSSLAQVITYRMDQVVVLVVSGAAPLGQYSIAVFGMSSLWLLSDSIGELEYPAGTRLDADDRRCRARRVAIKVTCAVGALAAAEVVLAPFLVEPVLGKGFEQVPLLLLLLLPGTIANAAAKVTSAALYAGGQGDRVRSAVVRAAAAVAVLTVPIVHFAGAIGAAAFSSVVYTLLAAQVWRTLHRQRG
jgi:O-antigen/teichoic acid export membrane protein